MLAAPIVPTYYEYILMSQYAYLKTPRTDDNTIPDNPSEPVYSPEEILAKLNGGLTEINTFWYVVNFNDGSHVSGYVGSIFYNEARRQIVVAHAGTLPERFASLRADALGVIGKEPDPLLIDSIMKIQSAENAEPFSDKIKKGYRLSFTGHSLGGFLAEMSVYACHRGYGLHYDKASAVTFDSPGSIEVMEHWESNLNKAKINLKELNIVSFLSSPNLVNTLYSHPGSIYRLIHEYAVKPNFFTYLLESHSLNKMIPLFDPATGNPYPNIYQEMEDWPLADYNEVFSLGDRLVSGTLDLVAKQTINFLWNLGKGIADRVKGSDRKTKFITLFGGDQIKNLEEILAINRNYHPQFDTMTPEGLTNAIRAHYVVSTQRRNDHLGISQVMSYLHFEDEVYLFLIFYAKNKNNPTYKNFLEAKGLTINLADYVVDTNQNEIKITNTDSNIFRLRDQIYQLFGEYSELLSNHAEIYQDYLTSQILILQNEQKELQAKINKMPMLKNSMQAVISQLEENIAQLKSQLEVLLEAQQKLAATVSNTIAAENTKEHMPTVFVMAGALADKPGSLAEVVNLGLTPDDLIKMAQSIENRSETIKGVGAAIALSAGASANANNIFSGALEALPSADRITLIRSYMAQKTAESSKSTSENPSGTTPFATKLSAAAPGSSENPTTQPK